MGDSGNTPLKGVHGWVWSGGTPRFLGDAGAATCVSPGRTCPCHAATATKGWDTPRWVRGEEGAIGGGAQERLPGLPRDRKGK